MPARLGARVYCNLSRRMTDRDDINIGTYLNQSLSSTFVAVRLSRGLTEFLHHLFQYGARGAHLILLQSTEGFLYQIQYF
jgi:hypothetical protein